MDCFKLRHTHKWKIYKNFCLILFLMKDYFDKEVIRRFKKILLCHLKKFWRGIGKNWVITQIFDPYYTGKGGILTKTLSPLVHYHYLYFSSDFLLLVHRKRRILGGDRRGNMDGKLQKSLKFCVYISWVGERRKGGIA